MAQDTAQMEKSSAKRPGDGAGAKASSVVRGAEWALLVAVAAGLLDTLRFAAYYIPLPFAVNFEEGKILNAGYRIIHGLTPYPPVGRPPYLVNVYGPVFYYLVAPLVKWFGLSFTVPRLLVLASGLGAALLLVLLLRHWTKSWMIALGFGLSFVAVSLVRDWIYVLRVELFATALSLAGLYVFAKKKSLLWVALLFLAAIYTKITFISAPIACFAYLVLRKEWRQAWRLAGWMLLFGLTGLAALTAGTHGWALFHMFLTHPDPYRLKWYFQRIGPFALLDTGLAAGAVALAWHDLRRRTLSLPLLYCALTALMTLTVGKFGGDANELLEWQASMCLAAGCGYSALRKHWKFEPAVALIPIGVMALVLLGLPESRKLPPELAGCPAAYQFAKQQPGELLTGNAGIAALSGKKIWLSDVLEFAVLGHAGRLDQRPLAEMVRKKFFGLILINGDTSAPKREETGPQLPFSFWPPEFVTALSRNYHPVARFSCAYAGVAYEPNPTPDSVSGSHGK
jgi:hypothetical protein